MESGDVQSCHADNRATANIDVIEADAVATAVLRLAEVEKDHKWSGTASALLNRLEDIVGEKESKRKHWPGSAAALGGRLKRLAARLERLGVKVSRDREGAKGERLITIERMAYKQGLQNAVSAVSAVRTIRSEGVSADSTGAPTVSRAVRGGSRSADDADSGSDSTSRTSVRANLLKKQASDSADSTDSKFHTLAKRGRREPFVYQPNIEARNARAQVILAKRRR
jgi:hypothetical protein